MSKQPLRIASVLAIGVAVALSGASLAVMTGAASAAQGDKASEDKSRRVCRTVTPVGSRLTRRICRSQADWESSQQKTQDGVFDQQMKETTLFEQAPRP